MKINSDDSENNLWMRKWHCLEQQGINSAFRTRQTVPLTKTTLTQHHCFKTTKKLLQNRTTRWNTILKEIKMHTAQLWNPCCKASFLPGFHSYQSSAFTAKTVPNNILLAMPGMVHLDHAIILHKIGHEDMALDPSNPLFASARRV